MESDKATKYSQIVQEAKKIFDEVYPISNWNYESNKDGVDVYTRTDAATGLKMARGEGLVLKPTSAVEDAIRNPVNALKWEDVLHLNETVEECGEYTVTKSLDKKKMLITQRETLLLSTTIKGEDGSLLFIGKSLDHPSFPESKDYVRAHIYLWAWHLIPDKEDPNKTKLIYIMFLDPKGKIPTTIYNGFVKEQSLNVWKVKKFVEKS